MSVFVLPSDSDLSEVGVYNVLNQDYGTFIPDSLSDAGQNAITLQNAINAALQGGSDGVNGNGGGILLIPTGIYYIAGPIYIGDMASPPGVTGSLTIIGTSGNTTLIQTENDESIFEVNTQYGGGPSDIGGITFQDLTLQYNGASSGVAVAVGDMDNAQNIRLFRVNFIDCPQALYIKHGLQSSMLDCTVTYESIAPASPGAIQLGGTNSAHQATETYISNCTFVNNYGPSSAAGVYIQQTEHVRIVNCQMTGFQQGIQIQPNGATAVKLFFENVSIFTNSNESGTGAAVLILASEGSTISQVHFVGCDFEPLDGTSYTGSGVLLQQSGGGSVLDQLRFTSCYSSGWGAAGLEINGGSNIEIIGGTYSCNGTVFESPVSESQAGIYVTSSSSELENVRIIGAACNNAIIGGTASQEYGVSIDALSEASGSIVQVRDCDLQGNLTAGAYVVAGSAAEITNCAGYNDLGSVRSTTAPSLLLVVRNTLYHWYGPIAIYVQGGSSVVITIDGHVTGLISGLFTLAPGETMTMSYSTAPSHYLVIGK